MEIKMKYENAKEFNAELKRVFKFIGFKVKVRIINGYNFPKCWVDVGCMEGIFPNELRLAMFDCQGLDRKNLINPNDVNYGNIGEKWVAMSVGNWEKLVENL